MYNNFDIFWRGILVILMLKIESVSFLQGFQLDILLSNGIAYVFDMKPKLDKVRFYDLNSWDIFSNGQVKNNQIITWNDGTAIHLDEILPDICQ